MDNILVIFICLVGGVTLKRLNVFPANSHLVLNQYIIYFALPAITLYYIPKVVVRSELLYPVAVSWIGFGVAFLFFNALGKWLKWPSKLTGCLILLGGLGNTAFVGFPVIEALYGKRGLETAIVLDQAGTFVVMATFGIMVAALYSGKKADGSASAAAIFRKIFTFPPFLAFIIGLGINLAGLELQLPVQEALLRLGKTIAPVALMAVGLQLEIDKKSSYWRFVWIGLLFKLLIMPAIIFILYKIVLHVDCIETSVSVMQAGMAPMITASILANAYGLKPKLAGMLVGVGIPASFITLDLWYWLLINF